jgi:hypothetical protein
MTRECDCGAASFDSWADKHSPGCALVKPDLIDRAALLKKLRKERDEYMGDHFMMDPQTGIYEAALAKEEYLSYLDENIEMIENLPAA